MKWLHMYFKKGNIGKLEDFFFFFNYHSPLSLENENLIPAQSTHPPFTLEYTCVTANEPLTFFILG